MDDGELILATGALLAGGMVVAQVGGRIRLPGLVLVLGFGMAIGSDGLGWVEFNNYDVAQTVGIVALALILFEGGLAAGLPEIRPVLGPSLSLAVVGTLITALLAGLVASWLFDLTLPQGMLLGSILASTDGAAVFAVLRGSTLRRRLARTLEGEAGFNDPVAVLLVLGFIDWIQRPHYGVLDMLGLFFSETAIGLGIGVLVGVGAVFVLRRVPLATAGLYPVASLAAAALAYGAADTLHGSGFLAVYLTGLALGSVSTPAQRTIASFHDGLAWVAQLVMFLTLGLLVFPGQLGGVIGEGTALAVVVAVIARPIAVFVSTVGMRFSLPERLVLGWAGLRGAVPVVLATFPVLAGVADSREFFNIVFFAVLLSTVAQGMTFEGLARRLGVTSDTAALPAPLMETSAVSRLGAEVVQYHVRPDDAAAGRLVRELELPRDALLNLIVRDEQAFPPRGSTRVEPGDDLHLLVRQETAVEFRRLLERWRDGPLGPAEHHKPVPRGATVFSTRPWQPGDGDPSRPEAVRGIPVIEQLRTRRDRPGALVALEDGRFAYTGPTVAVGSAPQLQDAARRRLRSSAEAAEQAWCREIIGALAIR